MAPTSYPKSFSTWFTLSRRSVSLPCSSSLTKRRPTPAFSARTGCVRPVSRLLSFTNSLNCIAYTLSGTNIAYYWQNTPFRVYIMLCPFILYPKGYILWLNDCNYTPTGIFSQMFLLYIIKFISGQIYADMHSLIVATSPDQTCNNHCIRKAQNHAGFTLLFRIRHVWNYRGSHSGHHHE